MRPNLKAIVLVIIVLIAGYLISKNMAFASTIAVFVKGGTVTNDIKRVGAKIDTKHAPAQTKVSAPFPAWYLSDARKRGFPHYAKMDTTPESVYSCLAPSQVAQARAILLKEVPVPAQSVESYAIDDMTTNVLGDGLNFALTYPGCVVRAVEPDPATFKIAVANAARFPGLKIVPINKAAGAFLDDYEVYGRALIKYFDPPWGGADYQEGDPVTLALGKELPLDYAKRAMAQATVVIVKIPPRNFDEKKFVAGLESAGFVVTVHNLMKPKANAKGAVAFKWVFIKHAK